MRLPLHHTSFLRITPFFRKGILGYIILSCIWYCGAVASTISGTPNPLDFKKVKQLSQRDGYITITNTFPSKVTVKKISILSQNSFPNEFKLIAPPAVPFDFPSTDERQLQIRFTPQQLGSRSAFLEVIVDTGTLPLDTTIFMLQGEGLAIEGKIHIVPDMINFGTRLPFADISDTITVYCDGPDSATLIDYQTANDNGNPYFEVEPLDPLEPFPIFLQPDDSIKFLVTFHPILPVGSFTGRVTMEGILEGFPICEFFGSVAVPDISLSPNVIDFGIVAQNEKVDTVIALVNNGGIDARIQSFVDPSLPFTLVDPPPTPFFLPPGDTIWLKVSLNSANLGPAVSSVIASEKTPGLQLTSKVTTLQASIVPNILQALPTAPLTLLCGIDSIYDAGTLRIRDTGAVSIKIDGITSTDNALFLVNSPFPDSLHPSQEKIVQLRYHYDGTTKRDSSVVIQVIALGRVVASDTIKLLIAPSSYPVQANVQTLSTDSKTGDVVVALDNAVAMYPLTTLKFIVTLTSDGAVDIDPSKITSSLSSASLSSISLGNGKYEITLSSSTPITGSLDSILQIGLHYYVTRDTNYSISVAVENDENSGCLEFEPISHSFVVPEGCGDIFYRESLSHHIIVNSAHLTSNPIIRKNGKVQFSLQVPATLRAEIVSITGLLLSKTLPVQYTEALEGELLLPTANLSSGSYILNLIATDENGNSATITLPFTVSN